MCEIFFLYARNGTVNTESLENLLKAALPAAKRNNDGFGIFNERKKMFKTKKKLKDGHIPNMVDEFEDSKFVVVHLRLMTQGSVCDANAHPFKHDNNVLVHNGGVTNPRIYDARRADSYNMLRNIDSNNDGDTVEAIKETMSDTSGRVSVFLHDDNHDLYYFRDTSKFTFAMNPVTQEYVGATRSKRLHNIWKDDRGQVSFFDNLQTRDPEQNVIYKIDDDNIEEVGEFDMDTRYSSGQGWRSNGKNTSGHPRAGKNTSQTTSGEEADIEACCILSEDEPEEEWSREEYEKEKAGMTRKEWQDIRAQEIADNIQKGKSQGMTDIYDLEQEMTGMPKDQQALPETVDEEVYDEQEYWEREEQKLLEEMKEKGREETKQDFFENQEERYEDMLEESHSDADFPEIEERQVDTEMRKMYGLDRESDHERPQVKDYMDDEVTEGLKLLFDGQAN